MRSGILRLGPAFTARSVREWLPRFGREGIELDDLAARVEALEEAASQRVKSPRWQ